MNEQNLGQRIKEARKSAGLTQKQLAERIHKSFSAVQKYEMNKATPPVDVIRDIAQALGVTWLELVGGFPDALELSMGKKAWHNLNVKTDIQRGIIAILSKLYGFAEYKEVVGQYGCSGYYLIGKGEKTFVLYDGDIDKIQKFIEKSLPTLVEAMADTRSEDEIISEIEEELTDPSLKKMLDDANNAAYDLILKGGVDVAHELP